MLDGTRHQFDNPPSYFRPEDLLVTPAQVAARLQRLHRQALTAYRRVVGDASLEPNPLIAPRAGSRLNPDVVDWRYSWGERILRGPQGYLAECLAPSRFTQGWVFSTPDIVAEMSAPGAAISLKSLQNIVVRTRAWLEQGGETLTAIVPQGIKGRQSSFYFRESLADQQARAAEMRARGIKTSGKVLYVMPDRHHPEWNFIAPNGSTAIGLRAKILARLTKGSMHRDDLIRYLWNLKDTKDVRSYIPALAALIGRSNRFLAGSNLKINAEEGKRGPRGVKTPAIYSIGQKLETPGTTRAPFASTGELSFTAQAAMGTTPFNEIAIIPPRPEAKVLNSRLWREIQTIIARSPDMISDADIRKLAATFGLNPGGNHLRTRLMPFIGGEILKRTRDLSWEARFDMYLEVKNKVRGRVVPHAQAEHSFSPALPKPIVESAAVQLPNDLEIASVVGVIRDSLPAPLKEGLAEDLGFARVLLNEMTEEERSEFLIKARTELYQALDPYQVGNLLGHHRGNQVYWDLILWAYQNRELFRGQF